MKTRISFLRFFLKILNIKIHFHHLLVVFGVFALLFRLHHLFTSWNTLEIPIPHNPFSLGKIAYAEGEIPPIVQPPSQEEEKKPFDPLGLDENQVKVLQSVAQANHQRRTEEEKTKTQKILGLSQEKIHKQIDHLEKIKTEIEKKKETLTKEETENILHTAKIYENMKPIAAAGIFNKIELIVLVPLMKKMQQKKAASIIAVMDPKKARLLTIEMLRA